jgi:TRAP-type transport system periplasmic protein
MKKMILCMLSLILTAGVSAGFAADAKVLKIAGVQRVMPTYSGQMKFAEIVNKKFAGRYEFKVFADNSLGDDVRATEGTKIGTIDMVATSSSPLVGLVPQLAVLDLPFLFPNEKAADYVLDGVVGAELDALLQKQGLKVMTFYENGYRQLTNSKHDVKSPSDLKGLKVRTMENPIHLAAWRALGANPTPMPFTEVFTALQQGTIDGQENPIPTIYGSKFYEVQKYVTLSGHVWGPHVFLMNKKLWDSFSAADKKIIIDAAKESVKFQRAMNRKKNTDLVAELKKNGMSVTVLTPAQLKVFQDAVAPIYKQFEDKIGKDIIAKVKAEIAKSQKK